MGNITVNISSDPAAMSQFAAELFAQAARGSVALRGRFLAALSGGGTPQALYRLLAESSYRESLPWEQVQFFWGDERCVPPEERESCYNQAWTTLLAHVPVPQANLHRAKGELGPRQAAVEYAAQLKALAAPGADWPRFDLVLLGLGDDGHTASLFPGSALTSGLATVAVTAYYQDRPANRVSLTPDVFNAAREVVFLATGQEKARALLSTLTGSHDPVNLPAQRIQPVDGNVWWLVDEAAASLLPEHIAMINLKKAE
jgi:6-phosphogluconolactonase